MTVERLIDQAAIQFDKIARDHNLVRWAEESQFALQAFKKNPKLKECTMWSIQDAIINVAAVGLTLNPALGYAYLVPEYDKALNANLCHLRVSFKGLIKVATDSGIIDWVAADVVKKNDTFVYRGRWELPLHEMNPFSDDRGDSVGVYCVAKMHDGQMLCDTAPWSEVTKARKAAKYDGVWSQWGDEMAKKFMIKRASKQWPRTDQTERLQKTVSVINGYEGNDQVFETVANAAGEILELMHHEEGAQWESIVEIYDELNEQERNMLFTAKTKGGYFEHQERKDLRTNITMTRKQMIEDHGYDGHLTERNSE